MSALSIRKVLVDRYLWLGLVLVACAGKVVAHVGHMALVPDAATRARDVRLWQHSAGVRREATCGARR